MSSRRSHDRRTYLLRLESDLSVDLESKVASLGRHG